MLKVTDVFAFYMIITSTRMVAKIMIYGKQTWGPFH